MAEKRLVANHLVPDDEVWVSPRTWDEPFLKNANVALPTAPNTTKVETVRTFSKCSDCPYDSKSSEMCNKICKLEMF